MHSRFTYPFFATILIFVILSWNFGIAVGQYKDPTVTLQATDIDYTTQVNAGCSISDLKIIAQSAVNWYVAYGDGRLVGGSDPLGYGSNVFTPHEAEKLVNEVDLSTGAVISATIGSAVGEPFAHSATATITATAMITESNPNVVIIELHYSLSGSGGAPQIDDPNLSTDYAWSRSGPSALLEFMITPTSGEGTAKFGYQRTVDSGNSSKSNFASTSLKQGGNTLFFWLLSSNDTTAELTTDPLPEDPIHVNLEIGASSSMWSEPRNFQSKGTVRYEFPCSGTDLSVEIQPIDSAEIVCKADGNLVLPVDAKVTYSGGSESLENVSVYVGQVNDSGSEATIDSIAPGTSETVQVEVVVSDFVKDSDGQFTDLELEAFVDSTGAIQESDEDNNDDNLTINGQNISLNDPHQYVTDIFEVGKNINVWTNQPHVIEANFEPKCNEAPIPLKTLASSLKVHHFNWEQLFYGPSTVKIAVMEGFDAGAPAPSGLREGEFYYGNVAISCRRLNPELDNRIYYTHGKHAGENVPLSILDGPAYDPIPRTKPGQVYVSIVDGPEEEDICWNLISPATAETMPHTPYWDENVGTELADNTEKNKLKFTDGAWDDLWVLEYRSPEIGKPNQFFNFQTTLVGMSQSGDVLKRWDSFRWKSNAVCANPCKNVVGGVPVASIKKPTHLSEQIAPNFGGVFDVEVVNQSDFVLLTVSPSGLAFSVDAGSAATQTQPISITNNGPTSITYTTSESTSWLSLSSISGTTPSKVDVSINAVGLTSGTYTGTIEIASGSQSETIPVTLIVRPDEQSPGRLEQHITLLQPDDSNESYSVGATISLTATSDSGLPVTLVSDTPSICSVAEKTVTILAPGSCQITASQTGDQVYAPAQDVTLTLLAISAEGYRVFIPYIDNEYR